MKRNTFNKKALKLSSLTLFLLAIAIATQAQKTTNPFEGEWDIRKCYVSRMLNDSTAKERYFKVRPAEWEASLDTFYGKPSIYKRIPVQETKVAFWHRELNSYSVGGKHDGYICICKSETPGSWETLQFPKDDSILIVEVRHLVKPSAIIEITAEEFPAIPLDTDENFGSLYQEDQLRYFKLAAGNWQKRLELICTHCDPSILRNSDTVRRIQEKLAEFGYDLTIDNVMSDETKAALFDFQQKHGLPIGQLDLVTLRFLGLK